MYYVYLIKNQKENNSYVGYTKDLKRRLAEHRDKLPKLIYYEAYCDKSVAQHREQMLKHKGRGLRRLKERLSIIK